MAAAVAQERMEVSWGLDPAFRARGKRARSGGRPLGKGVGLCVPGVCVQCALL